MDPTMIGWILVGVIGAGIVIAIITAIFRKYKLTFNTRYVQFDEEIEPIKARSGKKIYLPELISEDYEFLGWFFDAACTEPADLSKMPKYDAVLYAGWQAKPQEAASQIPETTHNIRFNICMDW